MRRAVLSWALQSSASANSMAIIFRVQVRVSLSIPPFLHRVPRRHQISCWKRSWKMRSSRGVQIWWIGIPNEAAHWSGLLRNSTLAQTQAYRWGKIWSWLRSVAKNNWGSRQRDSKFKSLESLWVSKSELRVCSKPCGRWGNGKFLWD